jgi:hypothetical protein
LDENAIREDLIKQHMKFVRDTDDRAEIQIKEQILPDGEFYVGGKNGDRSFRVFFFTTIYLYI